MACVFGTVPTSHRWFVYALLGASQHRTDTQRIGDKLVSEFSDNNRRVTLVAPFEMFGYARGLLEQMLEECVSPDWTFERVVRECLDSVLLGRKLPKNGATCSEFPVTPDSVQAYVRQFAQCPGVGDTKVASRVLALVESSPLDIKLQDLAKLACLCHSDLWGVFPSVIPCWRWRGESCKLWV